MGAANPQARYPERPESGFLFHAGDFQSLGLIVFFFVKFLCLKGFLEAKGLGFHIKVLVFSRLIPVFVVQPYDKCCHL